jgi:hypothetical protein
LACLTLASWGHAQVPRWPSGGGRKPSKAEQERRRKEEQRRRDEERRKEEEGRRAEAERQALERREEQLRLHDKAEESKRVIANSVTAFRGARLYYDQVKRERRSADDEIAGAMAKDAQGILGLPIVFTSPETGFAAGAFGMYYFHLGEPDKNRTSNVRGSGVYTTHKQALFDFGPSLWFSDNDVNVSAVVAYSYYPNFFVGIGNNTKDTEFEKYTERSPVALAQFQHRLVGNLYAGVKYRFESRSISSLAPGRALDSGGVLGVDGGRVSGAGLTLTYDSRDYVDGPTQGGLIDLTFRHNAKFFGSDYSFSEIGVDLRKYIPLGGATLALQLVEGTNAGSVPFYALSQIGGGFFLRGIPYGRYRDTHMLEGQVDLRFPIWGRWGGSVFGGGGEVAHSFLDFNLKGIHPAGGASVRFAIVPTEHLNIRLDFAYAAAGLATYLNIGEAF